MKLLVDYREKGVAHLFETLDVEIEYVNLPVGDFFLVNKDYGVLVERKTASDFLSSMRTNRLWDQLRRMLTEKVMDIRVKRRALLIHGYFSDEVSISGFGWNHIMGALMEIQYRYGIPVFYAEEENALMNFFRILIKRESDGKNDGNFEVRWLRIPPKREMSEKEWKIYILSSMPYVGEKLASKLLEKFGSIEKIAKASIADLKKVEGVGDKKAKLIYRMFH